MKKEFIEVARRFFLRIPPPQPVAVQTLIPKTDMLTGVPGDILPVRTANGISYYQHIPGDPEELYKNFISKKK